MGGQTATLLLRSATPEDTSGIGRALARHLVAGDAVALTGELGAGKTCLVRGAAAELGVTEPVTSPTFVLVRNLTGGRVPVVHCDVYRLDTVRDVLDLGDDVLAPDVVTFVEWGDAVTALLPDDRVEIDLRHDLDAEPAVADDGAVPVAPRRVRVRLFGRAAARLPALRDDLAPWLVEAG